MYTLPILDQMVVPASQLQVTVMLLVQIIMGTQYWKASMHPPEYLTEA